MAKRLILAVLFITGIAHATTAKLRMVDLSGAPFPNVLVIIKSFSPRGEVGRYLSGPDGRIPPIELKKGLYRIIATCPYGICRTTIRELYDSDLREEMTFELPFGSGGGAGELVGAPRVKLKVESMKHVALEAAQVLVRDREAKWDSWHSPNFAGDFEFDLPDDPTIVLVLYGAKVYEYQLATRCSAVIVQKPSSPNCLEDHGNGVRIVLPVD